MIWNDVMLKEWGHQGGVFPYEAALVNPASVDLRWSGRVRYPAKVWGKAEAVAKFKPDEFDASGLWGKVHQLECLTLCSGDFVLLDTMETVKVPEEAAGQLLLKSSKGRIGLEHLHAGWFDPGFCGTATLEVRNVAPWPVSIWAGERIVQLVLMSLVAVPEKSYAVTGRYQGQHGPQVAMGGKHVGLPVRNGGLDE